LTKLHYNPGQWWTYFADVFSICLILITLTGLFLVRGKYGLTGRGGVLLVVGLLFPLLFLLFF
ncbi:MAG: PepSY-associated TM helix domain-containing protein, partial [Bacteroides sp.]|nr:PepSY-associated TM helix domain-containing protein [Bacteroides sp.]